MAASAKKQGAKNVAAFLDRIEATGGRNAAENRYERVIRAFSADNAGTAQRSILSAGKHLALTLLANMVDDSECDAAIDGVRKLVREALPYAAPDKRGGGCA